MPFWALCFFSQLVNLSAHHPVSLNGLPCTSNSMWSLYCSHGLYYIVLAMYLNEPFMTVYQ